MTISKEQLDRIKNEVAKDNYDICQGQTEWEMVDVEVREALYEEVLHRCFEYSKMKNEDRPAYPTNARMHSEMTGVTKREFFIAHAPKVVPEWFTPLMPIKPRLATPLYQIFGRNSGHKHEDIFLKYWDEEGDVFPENKEIPEYFRFEVIKQLNNINRSWEQLTQWEADLNIQTSIQWPVFWADNMLKKLHVEQKQL